jgi:protein TonB
MFAGLEPINEDAGRRWTAAASFTVQATIVAAALVIPLLNPQRLPEALVRRRIFVPMSQGEAHAQPGHGDTRSNSAVRIQRLIVNRNNFSFHRERTQTQAVGTENPNAPWLPVTTGTYDGVINSIVTDASRSTPRPIATVHQLRVSVMMQGNLLHRVEPEYPPIAKQAGIQGTVVIKAFISRAGAIERTELLSGPPLLAHAALEAVRQWRYRPYYLNDKPVEVETQITVNFVLNR